MTIEQLKTLNPCEDALAFVEHCGSVAEAWRRCERGDWMFWLLRHVPTEVRAKRALRIGPLLIQRIPLSLASMYYAERTRDQVARAEEAGIAPYAVLLRLSIAASFAAEARTSTPDLMEELREQANDLRRLLPADFLEVGVTFVRPVP